MDSVTSHIIKFLLIICLGVKELFDTNVGQSRGRSPVVLCRCDVNVESSSVNFS